MTWLPIGPDFELSPKNPNYQRVSRRNAWGRGCQVTQIALDPTDSRTIYVVGRPDPIGATVFRTQNDGYLWTPLVDGLQQDDPNRDPSCIAINPKYPEIVYMSTFQDKGVYVSHSYGEPSSWGPRYPVNGRVRQLVVDPRTADDPGTTALYAATDNGLFVSQNGGMRWTPILPGDIWSLTAYMPPRGTAHFYASIGGTDANVWYTNHPMAGRWQSLNTGAGGMLPVRDPSSPTGNFNFALVSYSPRNPHRVYVWLARYGFIFDGAHWVDYGITVALYTTASPPTNWISVPMVNPPNPYDAYAAVFAVSPSSPDLSSPGGADGTQDVLFFGGETLWRSLDGGRNWQDDRGFMSDFHAITFDPVPSPPVVYIGCDGGIAKSDQIASRDYTIYPPGPNIGGGLNPPGDFNEVAVLRNLGVWQNLNYGRHGNAIYTYACDPSISTLSYISCQDTGFAAGNGALGWWDLGGGGDGFQVLAKQASDGVRLWVHYNITFTMLTDTGQFTQPEGSVTLGRGGPGLLATSNIFVLDSNGYCICGAQVTPSSGLQQNFVARVDQDGVATQISQDFSSLNRGVHVVAVHPTNPAMMCCALGWDRLWMTTAAGPGAVWSEISWPSDLTSSPQIGSIAIDTAGNILVLLLDRVSTSSGLSSPLLQVIDRNLVLQECVLPPGVDYDTAVKFGRIVAHPRDENVFFAVHGARVYELTLMQPQMQPQWSWEDISDGLPGQWVNDLWIGNIASPSDPPKILLRAAVTTRGVWEREVTTGARSRSIALYLRDNFLDQWWTSTSPDGVPNPYHPSDPGRALYHFQCVDIKIDALQRGDATTPDFFQTDPEVNPLINPLTGAVVDPNRPMTHVIFNMLKDNSQHLPTLDRAWVHVQVHNHSNTPADSVRVWALFCRASAGVPNLNERRRMDLPYDFWSQFQDDGQIIPNLPEGSPWTPIGVPITLYSITAANPQVASWLWTVPSLSPGDPSHYCIVAFVHSLNSHISETNTDVDLITLRNKQIGQKNLHIGPRLPSEPSAGAGSEPVDPAEPEEGRMTEYIEFHNPTASERIATLVFDLRGLPPQLITSFRFSRLKTVHPFSHSRRGIKRMRRGGLALTHFTRTIYEVESSALVEIRDVRIPAYGFCAARFSVLNTGNLEKGGEYWFNVLQKVKNEVVGGSVYIVRIAGDPVVPAWKGEWDEEEKMQEKVKQLHPWLRGAIEARMKETGRIGSPL